MKSTITIVKRFKVVVLLFALFLSQNIYCEIEPDSILNKKGVIALEKLLPKYEGLERARILNVLSEKLLQSEPKRSLDYARKAYNFSKGKDHRIEMVSIDLLASNFRISDEIDSLKIYGEKGLALSQRISDTLYQIKFYDYISTAYYIEGKISKIPPLLKVAINLIEKNAESYSKENESPSIEHITMFSKIASIYTRTGSFDSAMIYFQKSISFQDNYTNSKMGLARTYSSMGVLLYKNYQYEKALEYDKKAIKMYEELHDTTGIIDLYNNMAIVYADQKNRKKAIEILEKAYSFRFKDKSKRTFINILNNLALYNLEEKNLHEVNKYLSTTLPLYEKGKFLDIKASTYELLGMYSLEVGNYKEGIEYAKKSIQLYKQSGITDHLSDAYETLSKLYEKVDDYKASLENYKIHKSLNDSIFNQQSQENYNKLQTEFETAQKEKEIIRLKAEKDLQKEKQLRILIAASTLLAILILIIVIIILKRKKDKQIHEQKELVHQKEKELSQEKLEKSKLKEAELELSIRNKSKQLSTHALHMMQKNNLLQTVLEQVKSINKTASNEHKQELRKLKINLNQSLRSDKDWDVFKLYFEEINKTFYKRLNEINTDLTANDHRLCALIKLNMNSKEMASVLNLAPSSIKSSRHRLKKKLNLGTDVDMEAFIRGLE